MGKLDGKVAIVTGGAGSLGLAAARLFLAEGAKVMLADIAQEPLSRAAGALASGNLATTRTDVTQAASVAGLIAATVSHWGAIDVVFSNAGNFGTVAPIESFPEALFDAVYAVHVRGIPARSTTASSMRWRPGSARSSRATAPPSSTR